MIIICKGWGIDCNKQLNQHEYEHNLFGEIFLCDNCYYKACNEFFTNLMNTLPKMISKTDMQWISLAEKIAEESLCYDRHGCVIVRGGCVLAIATNRRSSHPISTKFQKDTLHAEQRAIAKILNAGGVIKGSTAYSVRLHKENPSSQPCDMCMSLLIKEDVKRIVYHNGAELGEYRPAWNI